MISRRWKSICLNTLTCLDCTDDRSASRGLAFSGTGDRTCGWGVSSSARFIAGSLRGRWWGVRDEGYWSWPARDWFPALELSLSSHLSWSLVVSSSRSHLVEPSEGCISSLRLLFVGVSWLHRRWNILQLLLWLRWCCILGVQLCILINHHQHLFPLFFIVFARMWCYCHPSRVKPGFPYLWFLVLVVDNYLSLMCVGFSRFQSVSQEIPPVRLIGEIYGWLAHFLQVEVMVRVHAGRDAA